MLRARKQNIFSQTPPAITKLLDLPSNSGKYADKVVDAFKRVADSDSLGLFESFIKNNNFKDVADYEKRYTQIISNVSGFQDELMLVIKNADERTALKIAEFASNYGKGVIGAVNKCGCENIYKIIHYITESGISNTTARKLFGALADHGDIMLKAIEKAGSKNIDNVVDIISKVNRSQVDDVINLIAHHGDDVVRAIKNCGTDKIDLILELASTSEKVTWSNVLAIERMPDKIVWLEEGLDDAQALAKYGEGASGRGFRHILEEHASHFTKPKYGIAEEDIKDFIMEAIRQGNYIPEARGNRPAYRVNFKGKDYVVGITVGDDGFIVGANPLSSKELSRPYINIYTNTWYNINP